MPEPIARLFDDGLRTDPRPARYTESTFAFLNRVEGPFWDRVRQLVNEWLDQHPSDAAADVRGRLAGGDDEAFRAAFLEIYVFQILRRCYASIQSHPETSTTRHPDFQATNPDGTGVIVEVTSTGSSPQAKARSLRLRTIWDAVNSLHFENFTLRVDAIAQGVNSPAMASLRAELSTFMKTLDHSQLRSRLLAGANYFDDPTTPVLRWTRDDWIIEFTPIPIDPGLHPGPTIGLHSPEAVWSDPTRARQRLREKAFAYGPMALPFVTAILTPSLLSEDESIASVLYGDLAVQWNPSKPDEVGEWIRRPTGAWYAGNRWRATNVSGVLTVPDLHPGFLLQVTPTLWHHPAAEHPIGPLAPIFRQAVPVNGTGGIEFRPPTQTASEFFGLPADWPGPEPRFPH